MIFKPVVFLARGDEKKLSQQLRHRLVAELYKKEFEIVTESTGKPVVRAEDDIGISISHKDGVVAFLITPFTPCGIDLEKNGKRFPERVKKAYLTASESDEECYREWCKREAYVKMTGEGLKGLKTALSSHEGVVFTDLSDKASELLSEDITLVACTKEQGFIKVVLAE